jgi:hypothetical protein
VSAGGLGPVHAAEVAESGLGGQCAGAARGMESFPWGHSEDAAIITRWKRRWRCTRSEGVIVMMCMEDRRLDSYDMMAAYYVVLHYHYNSNEWQQPAV